MTVLVIGIDAGGTKTTGIIVDQQKNVLFQTEKGYGNPNVHFDTALKDVWEAVNDCLASTYGLDCQTIIAGIAGIEAEGNKDRFIEYFSRHTKIPVILVNDAELAYHALLPEEDGILTIAGTGSISYGRNGEIDGYAGGWGQYLGDEGSSYRIAIQVCRQIAQEYDQGLRHSSLSEAIMREIGITDAVGLKGFIYRSTKDEIASLALPTFLEAQKGDETAKEYFYQAGIDLADQTASLYKKLDLKAPLKIACKGSLLENNTYVQTTFTGQLQAIVGEIEIIRNDLSPAVGACSIAKLYLPN